MMGACLFPKMPFLQAAQEKYITLQKLNGLWMPFDVVFKKQNHTDIKITMNFPCYANDWTALFLDSGPSVSFRQFK